MQKNTIRNPHLFSFLQFSFGALDELGLGSHGVVVSRSGEGSAEPRDLACGFIDGDNVTGDDFFLRQTLDHLLTQIVNRLHFRRLQRQLPDFGASA